MSCIRPALSPPPIFCDGCHIYSLPEPRFASWRAPTEPTEDEVAQAEQLIEREAVRELVRFAWQDLETDRRARRA